MVPLPISPPMLMLGGKPAGGSDRVTVNISAPSTRSSAVAATVNVWDSAPPAASASKVRLPLDEV